MNLIIYNNILKSLCTGCGACFQICEADAIEMIKQMDGCIYPFIDINKCNHCGQCVEVCHALGSKMLKRPCKCYATQNCRKDVLNVSTSGGMFYPLAKKILSEEGTIYGCIYDNNCNARIDRAKTPDELSLMHGSKYVWSDSMGSYPLVKKDLKNNKKVLYSGLPCQVAGLKKYLGEYYEGLFTVDLICGGAPSPYAFQKYLETLTDSTNKQNLCFQFRDKERYGAGVNCTYIVKGVKHYENYLQNSYYYAFSSNSRITWRLSCYNCQYKSVRRISDITIGDYWGVENYHPSFDIKEGVSLVLLNSSRGEKLFEQIKRNILYEESSVEYAVVRNSMVLIEKEGHIKVPDEREAFFHTLHIKGWKAADRKFLKKRKKILKKQFLHQVYNIGLQKLYKGIRKG